MKKKNKFSFVFAVITAMLLAMALLSCTIAVPIPLLVEQPPKIIEIPEEPTEIV